MYDISDPVNEYILQIIVVLFFRAHIFGEWNKFGMYVYVRYMSCPILL